MVSASGCKAGFGFLLSTQLFATAPLEVKVVVPGRILEFQSKIPYVSNCPWVKLVMFYGSNVL